MVDLYNIPNNWDKILYDETECYEPGDDNDNDEDIKLKIKILEANVKIYKLKLNNKKN